MKLKLPNVTLQMIETRQHALARLALKDCLDVVDFGDVIVLTDRPEEFSGLNGCRFELVEDWPDKLGWCRACWLDVPPLLQTSHVLQIQWDSWIWDVNQWTDDFLDYDYIGAPWEPWEYKNGCVVGNSGFSLISTRLKRFLRAHAWEFPCVDIHEDDLLCRQYRIGLEQYGFDWAPEPVAYRFSFESVRPLPVSKHFGFHGGFNFEKVLPRDRLEERLKLMLKSSYIADGKLWNIIKERNSGLVSELSGDGL